MRSNALKTIGLTAIASGVLSIGLFGPGCSDSKTETPTGAGGSTGSGGSTTGAGGSSTGSGGSATGAGGSANPDGGGSDAPVTQMVNVPAAITADTTWTSNNIYVLPRDTKVAVRAPAVLTIQPGTTIYGSDKSALVITRGAKIMAEGTAAAPIIFTSPKAAGTRAPQDWGGLIVMGKAPINTNALATPASTEAVFEAYGAADPDGLFGGTDAADNSGVIKYVRIEFGGVAYITDREWNNLTLCGVGSGTTIDYVQVHKGGDDGVEFFGGTVNVKHIVITQNQDDGFDTDNGWEGKAQFVVIQHTVPLGTDASNGYESDNHATATSFTAMPRTLPTVYNVTSIGTLNTGGLTWGAVFRRGTGGKYYNHIIMNFKSGVIEARDMATADQITAGNLFVKNSLFFNNGAAGANWPVAQATGDIDEAALFGDATWNNRLGMDPMLGAPTNLAAPNFKPATGSPALTGGATPPSDGFFDAAATFVGAVGADDWTVGWTAFPQG